MSPISAPAADMGSASNCDEMKLAVKHLEPPVAPSHALPEDYMYDFKYNHELPTQDVLGTKLPEDLDVESVAVGLSNQLEDALSRGDAGAFASLFIDYGVWRDKLAFTWDYRTFNWTDNISKAANDLLPKTPCRNFRRMTPLPSVERPFPDVAFLRICFSFETELVQASAVVHAVLTTDGWRIWTLHTVAESLHKFPEVDPLDGHMTGELSWETQRNLDDDQTNPDVLIIGGGQNGLAITARLKALGVPTLIIERDEIGDVWRKRYEYLSLHSPHWADHFAYFPFPDRWPTYTPAQKLGVFMKWYAHALELPVWSKSTVVSAEQTSGGKWTVVINKNGESRKLHPKHVVMATSLCGVPKMPVIPGMDIWKGTYRHSTQHDSSRKWVGKRVLVVGTSSSGFDTAYDCARRNIDVTMLQRSPTYIMSLEHAVPRAIGSYQPKNGKRPDIAELDRLGNAMPLGPAEELGRRNAKVLEELDKELLGALHEKGLKTWRGQRGTGQMTLGSTRNGGFYFDAGACGEIINGRIKVKQGSIQSFTEDKVILSGGREREYDLVIFATGFSNTVDSVRQTLGDDIADRCGPIWGVDEEGEVRSTYKFSGVPNLWFMLGFLPMTRYHSKYLALRIKALLEGVSPPPYAK